MSKLLKVKNQKDVVWVDFSEQLHKVTKWGDFLYQREFAISLGHFLLVGLRTFQRFPSCWSGNLPDHCCKSYLSGAALERAQDPGQYYQAQGQGPSDL